MAHIITPPGVVKDASEASDGDSLPPASTVIAGFDGTAVRTVATDASGRILIESSDLRRQSEMAELRLAAIQRIELLSNEPYAANRRGFELR